MDAIVLIEHDDARAREVALEVADVARIGAAPAVDRLVVVAHRAEVAVPRDELLDHEQLRAIRVLVLVHHHVAEGAGPALAHVGVLAQEAHRLGDEVVEVDRREAAQRRLVTRIDVGGDGVVVVAVDRRVVLGRAERVLGQRDAGQDAAGVVAPVLAAARVPHQLAHHAHLIGGVVDHEAAREAERRPLALQDGQAQRVKRAHGQLARPAASALAARRTAALDQTGHAGAHLGGRLVGEGERRDVARIDAALEHQVRDAVGDHAGLARPGAGDDQERAALVQHRLPLGRVEMPGIHRSKRRYGARCDL